MKKTIPISYVVKSQHLEIRIFEIEDGYDDDYHKLGAYRKAQEDYIDKMFLDDEDTKNKYECLLNRTIIHSGTYKEICDLLREWGYVVLSLDNATKSQIKKCEKECVERWKVWKKAKLQKR